MLGWMLENVSGTGAGRQASIVRTCCSGLPLIIFKEFLQKLAAGEPTMSNRFGDLFLLSHTIMVKNSLYKVINGTRPYKVSGGLSIRLRTKKTFARSRTSGTSRGEKEGEVDDPSIRPENDRNELSAMTVNHELSRRGASCLA